MILDAPTHFLPKSCVFPTGRETKHGAAYQVRFVEADTGEPLWEGEGVAAGFDLEQLYSVSRRRSDMDRQGVDVQVLSVPPPFGFTYTLDPLTSAAICRFLNDALVAAAGADPGRFLAPATLPLQSAELSLPELDRAATELGVSGVAIGTHVGDRGWQVRPEARIIPHPPSRYFTRLWFDSLTHSAEALEYLVRVAGAERVLLGTDYPYDMCQPDPVGSLTDAGGLSDAERQLVSGSNAGAFFDVGSGE